VWDKANFGYANPKARLRRIPQPLFESCKRRHLHGSAIEVSSDSAHQAKRA